MKINKLLIPSLFLLISSIILASCASIPKEATVIKNFKVENYLGKWYELARIDFKQEKNLNNTTAEYILENKNTIKVTNKGYNYVKNEWKQAIGKAKFRGDNNLGALKVSFFGPFYSEYNIIDIDENYQYALIAGRNLDYLWILSRDTSIPNNIKERFLRKAKEIGYDTSRLLWVEHNSTN